MNNELYLDTAIEDKTYIMIEIDKGNKFREKIYSIGLNVGVEFKVMQNSGQGPIEVEVRNAKLAIGRGMCKKIKIKENE